MDWLSLISQVGNADLVRMFLQGKITRQDLASEIGNSNTDLVVEYKNSLKAERGNEK